MTGCGSRERRPSATIALASDHEYFVIDRLVEAYSRCGFEAEFVGWDRLSRRASGRGSGPRCRYIMQGWGYANWALALALPLWCLRLFWDLMLHRSDIIHALDLDCALPAVSAGLFRKKRVVYDIQDNFEERHRFPPAVKWILQRLNHWVAGRSAAILVTDENRIIGGLEDFRERIWIVANCPPDLKTGGERQPRAGETIVGAFAFNLTSNRGIDLLLRASARVEGIKVLTAGRIVEPWLEELIRSSPHAKHLGILPQADALRATCEVDVVFAFYNPTIEINRRASSAKWYDAMMAGRPVISNREILNAGWIEKEGFGFTCDYTEESLADLLVRLRDQPEEVRTRGLKARHLFETRFNRDAMNQIVCSVARRALDVAEPDDTRRAEKR